MVTGDLICKKVFLNQKSWLPNGDQAKTLTWRIDLWCTVVKNMIIFLQVEKVWCGLLTLVDEVLLPSISLLECNSSLAEELWAMMCRFPYELRWVNPCTTPSVISVLLPLFHSNLLCKFKERGIFSGNNHRTSMPLMLYGILYFL